MPEPVRQLEFPAQRGPPAPPAVQVEVRELAGLGEAPGQKSLEFPGREGDPLGVLVARELSLLVARDQAEVAHHVVHHGGGPGVWRVALPAERESFPGPGGGGEGASREEALEGVPELPRAQLVLRDEFLVYGRKPLFLPGCLVLRDGSQEKRGERLLLEAETDAREEVLEAEQGLNPPGALPPLAELDEVADLDLVLLGLRVLARVLPPSLEVAVHLEAQVAHERSDHAEPGRIEGALRLPGGQEPPEVLAKLERRVPRRQALPEYAPVEQSPNGGGGRSARRLRPVGLPRSRGGKGCRESVECTPPKQLRLKLESLSDARKELYGVRGSPGLHLPRHEREEVPHDRVLPAQERPEERASRKATPQSPLSLPGAQ